MREQLVTTTSGVSRLVLGGDGQQEEPIVKIEPSYMPTMLRSMLIGTAGIVVLIAGYEPYLPHVGTSPTIIDSRNLVRPAKSSVGRRTLSSYSHALAMSVSEQAREVLTALALNKSQLADILRISRPTLYDWLEGKEPHPANAERMVALLRLIGRIRVNSSMPLNAKFVRQPLDERGKSLVEELAVERWDESRIESLLHKARTLSALSEANRLQREDRLQRLGYETPSDEQRRELLGQSVAMLDWP